MPRRSGMKIRPVLGLTSLAIGLCIASPARPLHEPGHPVRLVVPAAPGGATDAVARAVAQKISTFLNVPVFVENRPGGSGAVGAGIVKNAPADGSTLLFTTSPPLTLLPATSKVLQYNPATDFAPVTQVATSDFVIATSAKSPFKTINDLVVEAKAKPGTITYAIPGVATFAHLAGLNFGRLAGVDVKAVPYNGTAPALTDAISGTTAFAILPSGSVIQQRESGTIRILATSGLERSPQMPDVPTLREVGFNIAVTDWYAVFAPAKTEPAIVDRLNKAFVSALRTPEVRALLDKLGARPTGTTPGQLAEIRTADAEFWQAAFASSGLVAPQ